MRRLTTVAIAALLSSCASMPIDQDTPDVINNKNVNARETPVITPTWQVTLPPNYRVQKHDVDPVDSKIHDFLAHSLFDVGDTPVKVTLNTFKLDGNPHKGEVYDVANLSMLDAFGSSGKVNIIIPAAEIEVSPGVKGSMMIVGIELDGGSEFMVGQFVLVSEGYGFILQCTGDGDARVKLVRHCKQLLGAFKPTKQH